MAALSGIMKAKTAAKQISGSWQRNGNSGVKA